MITDIDAAPNGTRLSLAIVENPYSSDHGDGLTISYVDGTGKTCKIEVYLDTNGCMVIGADGDEKYTF